MTSVVEGQCIIRWAKLTLETSGGVSLPNLLPFLFSSFIFTQAHLSDESQSGRNTPGGRGRGPPPRPSGNNTSRGRGGGGGRGGSTPKLSSTSQLSKLWYEERPLLQPIKFVRSMETATLFQEAEELLESTAQYPSECVLFLIQFICSESEYPRR